MAAPRSSVTSSAASARAGARTSFDDGDNRAESAGSFDASRDATSTAAVGGACVEHPANGVAARSIVTIHATHRNALGRIRPPKK